MRLMIVMTTSWVPSCPSTEVIDESIAKLREQDALLFAPVTILVDGIQAANVARQTAYTVYKNRLIEKYNDCAIILHGDWRHQAGMMMEFLDCNAPDLILFVEHDTWVAGEIPWRDIAEVMMRWDHVKLVRFHIFDRVLPEHEHLYHQVDIFGLGTDKPGLTLRSTTQWSQRPHLAKADWYRDLLQQHFRDGDRGFIEDRLASAAEAGEIPGLYVYAPEGNMLRSFTSDGRQGAEKAPAFIPAEEK